LFGKRDEDESRISMTGPVTRRTDRGRRAGWSLGSLLKCQELGRQQDGTLRKGIWQRKPLEISVGRLVIDGEKFGVSVGKSDWVRLGGYLRVLGGDLLAECEVDH